MSRTRVFFDVSALPEVGKAVTGISRVILCVLRHMVLEHPQLEVLGISFRGEVHGYQILSLAAIKRQAGGLLDGLPAGPESLPVAEPAAGDCILLLGEQWLFPACLPAVRKLQRDNGVKAISLVHDLVPFFMPELYWDGFPEAYMACVAELAELSNGLVVYSDNTRRDLLKQVPAAQGRESDIHDVRLGDRFDFPGEAVARPQAPGDLRAGEYILCVGTIQPRKNHQLLLSVWRRLAEMHGTDCPTLVLVGKQGWHVGDLMYFLSRHPILKDKVKILEQVGDGELQWLYNSCAFSVYPSLYEGWGLPIAESLAAGKLCLASNASAMPEVAGTLIDYFSPHDSGELLRLIQLYLGDPALLAGRERAIKSGFTVTSWADTAAGFAQAISKVVQKGQVQQA